MKGKDQFNNKQMYDFDLKTITVGTLVECHFKVSRDSAWHTN